MSLDASLSDSEFVGAAGKSESRDSGQPVSGQTQTMSTSTTPAVFTNPLLPTHYRLVAVSNPVHVRLTTFVSPTNATTSDMYLPVGVPTLVRLGVSSWEVSNGQAVVYNQISARTTTGTGTLYATPLRY